MAKVSFKRIENSSGIDDVPVADGQVIYTGDGKQYMDYGTNRVEMSSGGGSGSSQGIILWTNSDTTRQFPGSNIVLSDEINNCYEYEVIYLYKTDSNSGSTEYRSEQLRTGRIQKDRDTLLLTASYRDLVVAIRTIEAPKTELGITYMSIGSGSSTSPSVENHSLITGVDNYKLIPQYIIGYTDKSYNY